MTLLVETETVPVDDVELEGKACYLSCLDIRTGFWYLMDGKDV